MTIKAVVVMTGLQYDANHSGKFLMGGHYAGLDPNNPVVQESIEIVDLDPGITALTLEETIKQHVKNHITTNYGYSFGLLDSVRLIGALL